MLYTTHKTMKQNFNLLQDFIKQYKYNQVIQGYEARDNKKYFTDYGHFQLNTMLKCKNDTSDVIMK